MIKKIVAYMVLIGLIVCLNPISAFASVEDEAYDDTDIELEESLPYDDMILEEITCNDEEYDIEVLEEKLNIEENEIRDDSNKNTGLSSPKGSGTWVQYSNGKWKYRHSDGSYTLNDWEYIDGKWYYFDSSGWMVTGWYKIGDYWYYFEPDGVMCTESFSDDQCIYYFYSSGKLRKVITRIKRRSQAAPHWCWAACASMTGKFITGTLKSQSSIVNEVKNAIIDQGATDNEMTNALRYACDYQKNWDFITNPYFEYQDALAVLDARKTFTIHFEWSVSSWHYVVCGGYSRTGSKLRIIDTWEDSSTTYYNYDFLRTGVDIQSGTGWWNGTHKY